jgi:hypothetical protein
MVEIFRRELLRRTLAALAVAAAAVLGRKNTPDAHGQARATRGPTFRQCHPTPLTLLEI